MASTRDAIADYLVLQCWQIVAVFIVVFAGSILLQKASDQWRYLLWLVVVARCVMPPLLSLPIALLQDVSKLRSPSPVSCASRQQCLTKHLNSEQGTFSRQSHQCRNL